jgi:hypothetical protein
MAPSPATTEAATQSPSSACPSTPARSYPSHPHRTMGWIPKGWMAPLPATTEAATSLPSSAHPSLPAWSTPSPPTTTGGGATAAEHRAATTLQCWKRCIWLSGWFAQQAEYHQRGLRLLSLCRGTLAYAVSVWGNRQPPPTPTDPTQRSSVIPSRIMVCRYHEGGGRNSTIAHVVAQVEGIVPMLPILEGGRCACPLFLGYTDCGGSIVFFCWGREVKIYTLPPTPLRCLMYPTGLPVLRPLDLTTQQSHCLYAICLHFLLPPAQLLPIRLCCQIGVQKVIRYPLSNYAGIWREMHLGS